MWPQEAAAESIHFAALGREDVRELFLYDTQAGILFLVLTVSIFPPQCSACVSFPLSPSSFLNLSFLVQNTGRELKAAKRTEKCSQHGN